MLGAIAGDVIGSVYEHSPIKTKQFDLFDEQCRFTDDTVLTVATADCLMHNISYEEAYTRYSRKYPNVPYGGNFRLWVYVDNPEPYNSFGNGSAMRVSPVGFAFDSLETTLEEAKKTAGVTHDHPEGIRGAQAVAASIFLARNGSTKDEIRDKIQARLGYSLSFTLKDIRPNYTFDVTCQGSVPQAIVSFLESIDFEDAVRNAISLGGDSDTLACMAGGMAQAFYKSIPEEIEAFTRKKLPQEMIRIMDEFNGKYSVEF